tara:strand:+ start:1114 stop:2997 length:1884 start_codon:yes stop_codon:yes gene_type:complete
MAGYLGSRPVVVQVDGYQRTEAESRYVNVSGDDFTGHLDFTDDAKARFGSSDEMHIYTESSGSGYSYIQGDNIVIRKADQSTNYLTALGGVVRLQPGGGNVGIGSVAPTQNLHVSSADHTKVLITGGTDKYAELQFENDAQKFSIGVQNDDKFFMYNNTGSSPVLEVDTSSNIIFRKTVGIGDTTLSTYNPNYPALELGASASIQGYTGNNGIWLQSNLFMNTNGQWTSKSDDFSAMLELYDGNFYFYNTASGTGTRTLLTPMVIKQNGSVGIGDPSPPSNVKLAIQADGIAIRLDGTANTTKTVFFRNTTTSNPAQIYADGSLRLRTEDASTAIIFNTNSTGTNNEAMRIDSSQNLMVGRSALGISNTGHTLAAAGYVEFTRDGAAALNVGRNSSFGETAVFWKDGVQAGSIHSEGGYLKVLGGNGTSVGSGLLFTNTVIAPRNHTGGTTNGTIDLGYSSEPFKDIHIGGRVKLGSSGGIEFGHATASSPASASSTLLDHYEEGTFEPTFNLSSGSVTMNSVYNTMSYTRVGRLVTVFGLVITASVSSPGGNYFFVDNLPYTSCNLTEGSGRSGGGVFYWDGSNPHVQPWEISEASTRLTVYMGNGGASNLTGGDDFYFSCTYQTS